MTGIQRLLAVVIVVALGLSLATCSDDDSTSQPVCHLTIVSPNGGEVYSDGQTYTVQWDSDGPCDCAVDLELLKDGEVCRVIADGIENTGSHTWQCSGLAGGTDYRVRATLEAACGSRTDASDADFTILPGAQACDVNLTSPAGGEHFVIGQDVTITWDVTGTCTGTVKIELLHGGTPCATISPNATNDGDFIWDVGRCLSDSTGYAIRITESESGAADESAGTFVIGEGQPGSCTLTVTAPNGGEALVTGQLLEILWSSAGSNGSSVKIELIHDGEVCSVIAAAAVNNGHYSWSAAPCASTAEGYQVRVTDLACGAVDASDGTFEIRGPLESGCRITVTRPELNEQLVAGQIYTILWDHTEECGGAVRIELYRLGVLCTVITESTPNDGSYEWVVDGCGAAVCGYTIRVIDLETGSGDSSDDFGIETNCELTVSVPNGGETYSVGEAVVITWEASDCGREARIELLQNGVVCQTLAAETTNDGLFIWNRAAQCAGPDGYTVRITDLDSGTSDTSDAPFRIVRPCQLTITSPPGGSIWAVGETLTIEWLTAGDECGPLDRIELIRNDVVCLTIAPETESDGHYEWVVSQCGDFTNGYIIRVTNIDSGAADETNGMLEIFTIPPEECALTLHAPATGASLCAGVPFEILWTHDEHCGDYVKIELLLGGAVCAEVVASTENDGAFLWTPELCDGQTAGYRLRLTDLGTGATVESAIGFSILPACSLRILAPTAGAAVCDGATLEIRWSVGSCCGAQAALDLLLNGEVCRSITAATPNDGSFTWTVARCGEALEGYAVRVTDLDTGASGESPVTFSIQPACVITVTGPTGEEIFCAGRDVAGIDWSASDCCGDRVRIELLLNGTVCATIAATTDNDGHLEWPVTQCGDATDGYTIRITDLETGASGQTEFAFGIEPACRLDLIVPDGSSDLCAGDPLEIVWTASDCCGATVKIELTRNGAVCETIAAAAPNNGSYTWVPVQCAGAESGYRIRVTDTTTGVYAESPVAFSIYPVCRLSVLSPNGGESLCQNVPIEIAWTSSTCCGDQVKIELVSGSTPCLTIAAATENDGAYPWSPVPCAGGGSVYRIRVTDLTTGAVDESNLTFEIAPACQITVTAPAGAMVVCEGDPLQIQWTSGSCCGELVKIELTRGGSVRAVIAAETANDGIFAWDAEQVGGVAEGYFIRVTDLETGAADENPFALTIQAGCVVTVSSPRNGDRYCIGDPVQILWDASSPCCGDRVRIELMHNGDLAQVLASSTPNDGTHLWPAAEQYNGYTNGYAIRVTNLDSGAANSISWSFSIAGGEVEVVYPNGGEEFCSGLPVTLTWDTSNCHGSTVKIELIRQGSVCRTITDGTVNDGSYQWTAAQCGAYVDGYKIRITDLDSGEVDESNLFFSIYPPCALSLSSPQSGDYCVGDQVQIIWEASSCCGDNLRLELLRDGSPCLVIAELEDYPEHSFAWPAAQCGGQVGGYQVRLTDLDSGRSVETSGTFSIYPPCVIEITSPAQGAVLIPGEDTQINWNFGRCCGETALIELLLDGVVCAQIAAGTPNDGSFVWPAAQCGPETEGYQIRVTDEETGAWDIVNVEFLPPCELLVTGPAAGTYCQDRPMEIIWTSDECGQSVKIELLHDGAVCLTIAAVTDNDGTHSWLPELCNGEMAGYQVRVTDLDTGVYADSPASFGFGAPCSVEVLWPTAGEILCIDREFDLLWSSSPCCGANVKLDLYRLGEWCLEISPSTENDGVYTWTAEMCAPLWWEDIEPWGATDYYRLRVTDLETGAWDESNVDFKIFPQCETKLLTPNGGEDYLAGDLVPITWESSHCQAHGICCGETVKIELLHLDEVCVVIAESTPNDRFFEWPAVGCGGYAQNYRIRVTDLDTGSSDTSAGTFHIVPVMMKVPVMIK